jgi:hypothetical protein
MWRRDKPADFSALLEKYADSALLPRGGWNAGGGRSDSVPSRNEVIRERLSDRFRSTYHDCTRSYALRESEIFALVELGEFRVISTDDLSRFAYDGVKDRLEQDLQNLKKNSAYLATRNRSPKQLQILGAEFDHRKEPDFRAASKQFSENSGACRPSTSSPAERRKVVANSESTAEKTKDRKSANSR